MKGFGDVKQAVKTVAIFAVLMSLLTAVGCSEKPFPEPELSYEVIFGAENDDPCGVELFFELHEPAADTGILSAALARRRYYAVSGDSGRMIPGADLWRRKGTQPELNKKAREKWNRKLFTAGQALGVWSDTGLWMVSVQEGQTYPDKKKERKPVEYAGKDVICEVTDGEVIYSILPPSGEQTEFRSEYSGRIGDRYYGTYWWYDLSAHELKLYASDDELPPVTNVAPPSWYELRLPDGRKISELIGNQFVHGELIDRVGDTAYYLFGDNNIYRNSDGSYPGDTALLVIYDCGSAGIMRIDRYGCANLNISDAFIVIPEE